MKQAFTTDDGKTFDTEEEARAWEERAAKVAAVSRILQAAGEHYRDGCVPIEMISRYIVAIFPEAAEMLIAHSDRPPAKPVNSDIAFVPPVTRR